MNIFKKFTSLFSTNKSSNNSHELGLNISPNLKEFLEKEVLPGLNISADSYWQAFEQIIEEFSPRNKELLNVREEIQAKIDNWHLDRKGSEHNHEEYKKFLEEIGYIAPRSSKFSITTDNVDPEIKTIAGPQLVVPVMNARFALNATNARWGSLYDALYGTDIISESDGAEKIGGYNQIRGDKVISFAKKFLDDSIPLEKGNYSDVIKFEFTVDSELKLILKDQSQTSLKNNDQYIGYMDKGEGKFGLLFKSCIAIQIVNIASIIPSGTSSPFESRTAGFVIK